MALIPPRHAAPRNVRTIQPYHWLMGTHGREGAGARRAGPRSRGRWSRAPEGAGWRFASICGRILPVVLLSACGSEGPVAPDAPEITDDDLALATVGVPYTVTLRASGGHPPYAWSLAQGALPEGLGLDGMTGVIGGIPEAVGAWSFVARVVDNDGQSSTTDFVLEVQDGGLAVSPTPLLDGVVGVEYSVTLTAIGGDGVYTWSVTEGELPEGLLRVGETISGTPETAGYFGLEIQVASGGLTASATHRIRIYESRVALGYLRGLPGLIESARRDSEELLPRNPQLAEQIQAKIDMLSRPDLEARILTEHLYRESATTTRNGATIPVFLAFPADTMEAGALQDLARLPETMATLEAFLDVPWPFGRILEWYGFKLGHSGGGGTLNMEDRGTYANRGVPHDVILGHELGHTYIGNETLTQFLEVYAFNQYEVHSQDVVDWTWRRGDYDPFSQGNTAVHALLDIYQLLGPEAMGRAFATLHHIGVPYGQELGAEARQVFVDEAPAEVRDQVTNLVARI